MYGDGDGDDDELPSIGIGTMPVSEEEILYQYDYEYPCVRAAWRHSVARNDAAERLVRIDEYHSYETCHRCISSDSPRSFPGSVCTLPGLESPESVRRASQRLS